MAYLLADENNNSIKVAKYSSLDRCDLIENNEYGYCSLIKATKSVLAKFEIENKTPTKLTYTGRDDRPLWNRTALKEAIINTVHNDYSFEVPPKFEIFPDRLEITCAGRLPESMDLEEFFSGVSIPRNKELMRVYRDLELVESLGSGVPRILQAYGRECFVFMSNFIRMIFPIAKYESKQDTTPVSDPVSDPVLKLLRLFDGEMEREELQRRLDISHKTYFRRNYLSPAIEAGLVVFTIPDKPNSSKQRYRLTNKGLEIRGE